jgi:hypothetical protein
MKLRSFASAAAVATVAAIVVTACGPTAPDPTSTGPGPSTTTTPSTTVPPKAPTGTAPATGAAAGEDGALVAAYRWQRSADATLDIGGGATATLASVLAPTTSDDDWLIAGTATAAGGRTTATVWSSPDALTWTATALPGGGSHGQARGVDAWGERTVVVGSVGTGPTQRAAVWISQTTGAPFVPVPDTTAFDLPGRAVDPTPGAALPSGDAGATQPAAVAGAVMDSVTSGALGLFAVGSAGGHLAVWYSSDGATWTRLGQAESVIGRSPGAQVRQILETSAGVFAVGSVRHGSDTDAAVWASGNGTGWGPVSSPTSFAGDGDHALTDLITYGGSVVAVGGTRATTTWTPASWISPNGFTWGPPSESFPESTPARADLDGAVVSDVAVSSNGQDLVAVGGSPAAQRMWTSTDGISWTETALPPAATTDADWTAGLVATNGTTTVVVDPDPGQPRLLVDDPTGWTEVSADPAVFGTPQDVATPAGLITSDGHLVLAVDVDEPGQALGTEATTVDILTSTDGTTWSVAAADGQFVDEEVSDLTATAAGLVAVGGQVPVSSTLAGGNPAATVWTSADGTSWTAATSTAGTLGGGKAPATRAEAVSTTTPTDGLGSVVVAGTTPAGPALSWAAGDGSVIAAGTLDRAPGTGAETPAGACPTPTGPVVVGQTADDSAGSRGLIWFTTTGGTTQRAQLLPVPRAGSDEAVTGCTRVGGGRLLAWGRSTSDAGTPQASLWTTTKGSSSSWTRLVDKALAAGQGTAGISDLATGDGTWLALTGGTTQPWTEEDLSGVALWRSRDDGKTWQRVETTGAPWASSFGLAARLATFFDGQAVVVGQVDGRLATWTGTPTGT